MGIVVRFAALYVLIVFAIGCMFAAIRIFLLEPAIGPLWAVVVEVPVMVVLSYLACGPLVRRWWPLDGEKGIEIGIAAFILLQLLESGLTGLVGPEPYLDNILIYWGDLSAPRLVGLVGQLLFAAMPFVRILRKSTHE
ncbi:hypothetical protein [Rhizobium sp. L1K21]|uniref:hypothetical protein n=1 Tax=Rhizobium sp. L1K21 TaxID=2954933 RepID=UPI002093B1DD|nr:hypothetical protein [Rhizobium sp. L1K21]MCO6186787.1 hypothetical protein [Rhizobium sp. L1K21]